jgi:hypothetical protein
MRRDLGGAAGSLSADCESQALIASSRPTTVRTNPSRLSCTESRSSPPRKNQAADDRLARHAFALSPAAYGDPDLVKKQSPSAARPTEPRSRFQSELQFHECVIPLLRNEVERAARLFQASALELPQTLAAHFDVAHQARIGEDLQVLRDSLPGDVGSGRELCDRHRAFRAQDGNEAQTRGVTECRE